MLVIFLIQVEVTIDRIERTCIFPNDNLLLQRIAYVETEYGEDATKDLTKGGIWQVRHHPNGFCLL